MDDAVRLQYLTAMGIDVWVSRHQSVAAMQSVNELPESKNEDTVGWVEQSDTQHQDVALSQSPVQPAPAFTQEITDTNQQRWVSPCSTQPTASSSVHHDDSVWKNLQHEVSICRACSLCETRTQTVFGVGNKHADWLLIGEAPGRDEDLQGEPFVGRAGQLLNEMIRAIGLQRQQVYIANMLKCRPPNNRDPQAEEVDACNAFLQQQIGLIRPKIILAVGRIAAQNLLHTQQPLSRLRGMRHHYNGIPMIVIHHPAYLLRSLTEKAKAWEDLQFALSIYNSQNGDKQNPVRLSIDRPSVVEPVEG